MTVVRELAFRGIQGPRRQTVVHSVLDQNDQNQDQDDDGGDFGGDDTDYA